jgi:dTDP-L-rhamnose 4-epimerase
MYEIADYIRKNTHATAVFLERLVARPTRPSRLLVASSMSIYGEGEYVCPLHGHVAPAPRGEEQLARRAWECVCAECGLELDPVATREQKPLIPTSVYAVTKRDHEELALVVGAAYDIPATALRFFNVYGPGQSLSNPYTGVAAIFSSRLLNNGPPLVFEDGRQTRDFVHVSDIVEGLLLALASDAAVGRAINLGTGRRTSVLDVAHALADGLGVSIEPEVNGRYRAGDIRHCYADTTLAEHLLDFRADISFERGMNDLLPWLEVQEARDEVDAAKAALIARGLVN